MQKSTVRPLITTCFLLWDETYDGMDLGGVFGKENEEKREKNLQNNGKDGINSPPASRSSTASTNPGSAPSASPANRQESARTLQILPRAESPPRFGNGVWLSMWSRDR
ncbi:hypothetical protein EJ06DRAFT_69443 [Trichodelitschia bisporula]|uniref:Uncharacterized protein n=1 Tax=Trichodelitschia bisporula TaxID=703511 RepID=A0A6G1HT28_9PEZI|nr:hypothetical protein EJ06DRAFT_69443 [Trichodelitschia bisporula]